jgi:hypothetical protein
MPRQANIQVRRDTAANWTSVNPTLAVGEIGLETNTLKIKVGNGTAAWNSLSYANVGTADNALKFDGRKLYVSATAPASGMVTGDLWIKI